MEETVNDRIQLIINERYGGNVRKFERHSQIKPSTMKNIIGGRKTKPSFDILEAIIRNDERVSAKWLLTGKGSMIKQLYPGENLLIDEDGPSIVYHYTNMNSLISILSNLRLMCSVIEKSNDYKEKNSVKEMSFHDRETNNNLKYLSFCRGGLSYRNPILWHHYANAHKGACIGINISAIKKTLGGDVIYERNINDNIYSQEEYMMRKTPEWMGELEYRLLFLDGDMFFDIKDCLYSVCFGREVDDRAIEVMKEIIPVGVRIYKTDCAVNGLMGRHENKSWSGERRDRSPLKDSVIATIRGKNELSPFLETELEIYKRLYKEKDKEAGKTREESGAFKAENDRLREEMSVLKAENDRLKEKEVESLKSKITPTVDPPEEVSSEKSFGNPEKQEANR